VQVKAAYKYVDEIDPRSPANMEWKRLAHSSHWNGKTMVVTNVVVDVVSAGSLHDLERSVGDFDFTLVFFSCLLSSFGLVKL